MRSEKTPARAVLFACWLLGVCGPRGVAAELHSNILFGQQASQKIYEAKLQTIEQGGSQRLGALEKLTKLHASDLSEDLKELSFECMRRRLSQDDPWQGQCVLRISKPRSDVWESTRFDRSLMVEQFFKMPLNSEELELIDDLRWSPDEVDSKSLHMRSLQGSSLLLKCTKKEDQVRCYLSLSNKTD